MAATLANDAAIDNVSAYIKTLAEKPALATVKGNAGNGQERTEDLTSACRYCRVFFGG
jgi:hypothetical protein